ncbi:hydrolase 1, exosortase A system-associated, partial [Novosphingobium sp. 1949]|nr:hydrolase 1, exosortase A system-associated [Novosphingobium organovorum]
MSGREHLLFACEGSTLIGTLDRAAGKTALLIVSGGNETRAGAWDGQAWLAARVAAAGW